MGYHYIIRGFVIGRPHYERIAEASTWIGAKIEAWRFAKECKDVRISKRKER